MNENDTSSGVSALDAVYTKQILPEYEGNPMIEALPPIMDPRDVESSLRNYPPYKDSERQLEAHYRFHLIDRLYDFFQPADIHIDIEGRISRTIRRGYLSRNPIDPSYNSSLHETHKAITEKDSKFTNIKLPLSSASGFSLRILRGRENNRSGKDPFALPTSDRAWGI